MRFLAIVLMMLALGAALFCAVSLQRGDELGQWLFGCMALLLAVASGMTWNEDRK